MAKKSSTWFVLLVVLFLLFLGIVGTGVAINYFDQKVKQKTDELLQQQGGENSSGDLIVIDGEAVDVDGEAEVTTSSRDGNVVLYHPTPGEVIKSPYVVTGRARVFENVVNYELKDKSGNILAEGFAVAGAADVGQFGEFEINLSFVTSAGEGILEVYTISAKDGSKEDIVRIEVGLD